MYCTKCGGETHDSDVFCTRCGNRVAALAATEPVWETPRRLMLDKKNKKISGVCAGFARYFGMDIVLMRVIWLAIAIGTGVGFLVYLGAWIVLPSDKGFYEPAPGAIAQTPQRY
jgi:phage shock protein C